MILDSDVKDIDRLFARFVRELPDDPVYEQRLVEELQIILELQFTNYFLKVRNMLDLTKHIPHMTRGSAGSSLVCWLLGITSVDPIKYNIPLARFLNPLRDDLPDIDIDVPHHAQEEFMQIIFEKWPGKTARLSNYVKYQDRSARREAVRRLGYKGKIPRHFTYESLGLDANQAKRIEQKLLGKKRCISKHCGGIVVFDRKLPKSLINESNQILLDKNEVEDLEHLKVDVLANRGLSQLMEISTQDLEEYPEQDQATLDLLCRGDVLGVTQGESPAMKRLLQSIQPTSRSDVIFASALIRPVATVGRQRASFFNDWSGLKSNQNIIYEDDAILKIASLLGCDNYQADMYRRAFAKKNEQVVMDFFCRIGDHPYKDEIKNELEQLSNFGLCRAHAVNLGRLIWALAYQKAHNPLKFWQACLAHCQGSYEKWVYKREAFLAGVKWHGQTDNSVFNDPVWEYSTMKYWRNPQFLPGMKLNLMENKKVEFAGLVANGRVYKGHKNKYVTFVTLGIDNGCYVDLVVDKAMPYYSYDVIAGTGSLIYKNNGYYIQSENSSAYKIKDFIKKQTFYNSEIFIG